MTDGTQDQEHGSVFSRVAQELLDTAERVTNTMEHGIQSLLTGSNSNDGSDSSQQQMRDKPLNDDNAEFSQSDYEAMVREQLEGSPLQGMAEQVIGGIMQGQAGPTTFLENISAFRHAINWTEPLLVGIVGFQIVMFLVTLWISRRGRSMEARLAVMVSIGALVKGSQHLNAYGSQHWETIATQNYFDRGGIFMTVLVCAPLLFDCFIMLICFLKEAASLLVQVKTAEIKNQRKQTKDGANKGVGKKKEQ